MSTRRIVLCADDYGQSEGVSAGILSLAASARLSAVSCLVVSPHWREAAPAITEHRDRIDVGLHFTLGTEPDDIAYRDGSLAKLIAGAYLHRLDRKEVEDLLEWQIDRFEAHLGSPPDFIDGHRHVHQLPVIRDALIAVYDRRLRPHGSYIRSLARMSVRKPAQMKSAIVQSLGGTALCRQLDAAAIPHNADFAGIRVFDGKADFRACMRRWLGGIADGGLIMCHPGLDEAIGDPIAGSRRVEHRYLSGDDFLADCRELGVRLTRGSECM